MARELHRKALEAYMRGELPLLGRSTTLRPESDYIVNGGYLEYLEHAYDQHPQQAGERHGPDPRPA